MNRVRRWLASDSLIAYGVLLAMVAAVVVAALILFQPTANQIFSDFGCLQCT